jgi:hypothetical protein
MHSQQIIFVHVTISDNAIAHRFIQLMFPKLHLKTEQNSPEEENSKGKCQHDIKKKQNLYSYIHQSFARY